MIKQSGIKFLIITCLVMLMGSSVKAEDITEVFTASNFTATGTTYKDFSGVTITDGTGNVYAGNSAKSSKSAIQLRSSNSNSGIVTTAVGTSIQRLKSITIEWNTGTSADRIIDVYGRNDAYTSAEELYNTSDVKITSFDYVSSTPTQTEVISEAYNYKYIGIRSKSGALYIDKITLVWETGPATSVSMPTFDPATGTDFADQLTVKASSATDGAIIRYSTTSAEDVTDASTVFPTDGLTLTETTTIYAKAFKEGLDVSSVAEATYTKIEALNGLAALREQIRTDNSSSAKEYMVNFTNAIVTSVNGKYAYMEEGETGILFYGSGVEAGQKLSGVATVTGCMYSGSAELTSITGATITTEGVVIPCITATIAELNANYDKYEGRRVKVMGANVTTANKSGGSGEISQNDATIVVRTKSGITTTQGQTINIIGYLGLYNGTKQLNVMAQDDITEATITLGEATNNSSVIVKDAVADITLTRTLSNSYWNTFCVPFDITAEQVTATFGSGTKITEYLGQDETTMVFVESDKITAGTPYLIKPAATTSNPTFNGVTITEVTPQTVTDGDYSFIGTYSPTTLATDGTALFVATDGTVKKPSASGNTIKGMRAYIEAKSESAAKALSLSFDGGTTGISTVESAADVFKADGKVYNMNGQQMGSGLDELPHGMYIVNGKKVIK